MDNYTRLEELERKIENGSITDREMVELQMIHSRALRKCRDNIAAAIDTSNKAASRRKV